MMNNMSNDRGRGFRVSRSLDIVVAVLAGVLLFTIGLIVGALIFPIILMNIVAFALFALAIFVTLIAFLIIRGSRRSNSC
ncbi:MAG: hypothetical protein PHV07_03850 [Oscillospiraceae bacterium]|nr:hypothetical protein [Oscillospiraceae bacterium]